MSVIAAPISYNEVHTADHRRFFTAVYVEPVMVAADESSNLTLPSSMVGVKGYRIDRVSYDTNGTHSIGAQIAVSIHTAGPINADFYLEAQRTTAAVDFLSWSNINVCVSYPVDPHRMMTIARTGSAINDQSIIYVAGEIFG